MRDVVDLHRVLDGNKDGLSMAEINSGIQDDHYTDRAGNGLYDDRAIGLAALHNHFEEFKGLSADGQRAITSLDIDKFKQIPRLIAIEKVAGDSNIVRFLDNSNGRQTNDGKITRTDLSEAVGDLQDGTTKEAVRAMLTDFAIISNGADYIDTASIRTQVDDYINMKLTPQEKKLAHEAEATVENSRQKLDHVVSHDIFTGDQTKTFQVLQSKLGDCFALSFLSSLAYRNPAAIKRIFGQDDVGNPSMRITPKDIGQSLPITVSVAPPTRAELATYAGSRGDSFSVNAAEKLMGELARKFPEQWSQVIGMTADPITNSKDSPSPHEYLDGGGTSDGLLTSVTGDEYKTYSLKSFRDTTNKLEEGLKHLKSGSPAVVILDPSWLKSGISSPTSTRVRSAGGFGDERGKEKTSKGDSGALPKKDMHPHDTAINPEHWGLESLPNHNTRLDKTGGGDVDWESTQRMPRSRDGGYHEIAFLNYNPATQELLLYNPWGHGEGSSHPKDGVDDGVFSISLRQLKELNGAICLPSYIFGN
jgi:hypothetical protein